MTALERAKSFLKSGKTKTALKLLPFALAAATANAGTVATTNFAMFQVCSGSGCPPPAVPEPATMVMLATGVAGPMAYRALKGRGKNKK